MSLVLAIEPDSSQADALKAIQGRFGAPLVVVSSKQEALRAIDREVPELLLVSALLSPRDETDLLAHLRTIQDAAHLQLLTIPQLGRAADAAPKKTSRFGFGKKKAAAGPEGCDPEAFAEQVISYLARARDVRSRPRPAADAHEPAPAKASLAPPPAAAPPAQATPAINLHRPPPAPAEDPLIAAAPAFENNAVQDEVDRLIERLGFGPDGPVEESDPLLLGAEPLIDPSALMETPAAADALIDAQPQALETPPALVELTPPSAADPLIDLAALLDPAAAPQPEPATPPLRLVESTPEPAAFEPLVDIPVEEPPAIAAPPPPAAIAPAPAPPAIDLAQIRAEAEAKLSAELERVQAEAAQRRDAELAQWRAEAEALREATVGNARAEAEAEAREALASELSRVRAEAEKLRTAEIARLQSDAEEKLAQVTREAREAAESEAARALGEQLARVRSETESVASKAFEEEVALVRAAADTKLQEELARIRREAEAAQQARQVELQAEAERARAEAARIREEAAREARSVAEAAASRALEAEIQRVRAESDARLAQQTKQHAEVEQVREAAAREARAAAEAAAARTLEAEIARVRKDADARLESEMAQLRADAEERRTRELEEIRQQVEEMRDAAAQQARQAASEAVAAEVARVAAAQRPSGPVSVVSTLPPIVKMDPPPAPAAAAPAAPALVVKPQPEPAAEKTPTEKPQLPEVREPSGTFSYYDLWRSEGSPPLEGRKGQAGASAPSLPSRFRRKRWMLPAAACLLLMVSGSVRVDTTAWRESAKKALASALPGSSEEEAAAPAAAAAPSGDLLVETTPKGAKVIVDDSPRGQTPMTVTGLTPGKHTLVLESSDGVVITREVTIRAGERAVASELMVSGWLTVHSRIPLDIIVGGRRVGRSGDGQLMLSPGRHKVTFANERYRFRTTKTIEIDGGAIASHTVALPSGSLTVEAPAGAEVFIDGARAGTAPLRGFKVAIGTRDIYVRHPSIGEHHESVEVRNGVPAFVTVGLPNDGAGRSFDGLKVLSESAANPGVKRRR